MNFIGLSGDRGSGKNTFARLCIDYIKEEHPEYSPREESFASLLKKSAAAALGFSADNAEPWADELKREGSEVKTILYMPDSEWLYETTGITGRQFLQNYGTEAHRNIFGMDFWVDAFWSTNEFSENDVVFICDARFDNEAQSIIDRGGIIAQVVNDRVNNNDSHASEAGLPGELISAIIDNNGTIEDLRETAKTFVDLNLMLGTGRNT